MSEQQPTSNDQANGSKDSPKISVPAGIFGKLSFELVPKTDLTIAAPGDDVKAKLTSPDSLVIPFPIKGTCHNFPNQTKCQVWWLVKKGDQISSEGPLDGVLVIDGESFQIQVGGKAPQLDLIRHKIVGQGALGIRIAPNFPHASPVEFAPGALTFNIPFGVEYRKPSPALIGSTVVFTPKFAKVFEKAEIHLEIVESDEGEGTAPAAPASATAGFHRWTGTERSPYTWAIGFTDTHFSRFTFADPTEIGDYEFAWRLTASSDQGETKTFTTLVENKTDFKGVKKPRLEQFKLEFDHGPLKDEVVALGKIANFAPGTHLEVDVALVSHKDVQHDPPPDWRKCAHSTHLSDDGKFAIPMVTKWIATRVELPDPHKTFGILTFQAAEMAGGPTGGWPITSVLDTDEAAHPGFKGSDVCFGLDAEWICSEEISNLVKTPAQLLDDDLVKRVLYRGGTVDPAAHDLFKKILAGEASVQKGKCDKSVAKALNRALIYLGYSTGAKGTYSIDGDFGAGSNFGFALFLRENARHHLLDEHAQPVGDKALIFKSSGNDETAEKITSFPVVPIEKPQLDTLLRSIDQTRRNKEVYLADCSRSIQNLDRIDAKDFMKPAAIVQQFKASIIAAAAYAQTKGVTIQPQWIAAFIATETAGVPRPKYEHHALWGYYSGDPAGGMRSGDDLVNIRECRFRSTSFGLGQLMGFNYKVTTAQSAFDLFKADEPAQVKMVAEFLISRATHPGVISVLASDATPSLDSQGFRELCRRYNGSKYAEHNYHGTLQANFQEVKKSW